MLRLVLLSEGGGEEEEDKFWVFVLRDLTSSSSSTTITSLIGRFNDGEEEAARVRALWELGFRRTGDERARDGGEGSAEGEEVVRSIVLLIFIGDGSFGVRGTMFRGDILGVLFGLGLLFRFIAAVLAVLLLLLFAVRRLFRFGGGKRTEPVVQLFIFFCS